MICDFSSFIEFVAATYFTMCIDNVWTKRFWSPNYQHRFDNVLEKISFTSLDVQGITDRVKETHTEWVEDIHEKMFRKSAFMLGISVLIILLIGIQECTKNVYWDFAAFVLLFLVSLFPTLLLKGIAFKKWKFTFFAMGLFYLLAIIVVASYKYGWFNHWIVQEYDIYITVGALFLLFLPILLQILKCWLYSSVYNGYLRNRLITEKRKYLLFEKGMKSNDKELIPEDYQKLIESIENYEGDEDCQLSAYTSFLEYRICKISTASAFVIFISWLVYRFPFINPKVLLNVDCRDFNIKHFDSISTTNNSTDMSLSEKLEELSTQIEKKNKE